MANETTQVRNTAPQLPERTLRIDGERTAAMYTLAIRVARLDSRFRELAGNPSVEGRKQYRSGNEGFARALGEFEDALMQIEKDVDMNSRRSGRQSKGQPQRREPQARPQTAPQKNSAAPAATTTPTAESKPAQGPKPEANGSTAPAGEAPKPRPNNRRSQLKNLLSRMVSHLKASKQNRRPKTRSSRLSKSLM